jgi:hypothetical protein
VYQHDWQLILDGTRRSAEEIALMSARGSFFTVTYLSLNVWLWEEEKRRHAIINRVNDHTANERLL